MIPMQLQSGIGGQMIAQFRCQAIAPQDAQFKVGITATPIEGGIQFSQTPGGLIKGSRNQNEHALTFP